LKYFLIAGEASGDLHGAALMQSLKEHDPEADFCYLGGDRMHLQGGVMVKHYREMAFMGAIEVITNLKKIRQNLLACKNEILNFSPDVVILIDYPGFNLKIAEFAHRNNFIVFWFIAPKVWAWKEWRVKKLKEFVDEIFTILPFETGFFARHNVKVHYVGNPLMDEIAQASKRFGTRGAFLSEYNLPDKPLVALLPGSRVQEIKYMLPVMTRLTADFPEFSFVIAGAEALDPGLYNRYSNNQSVPILFGRTYEILNHAHAALVTSGTASLEAAILKVPQAVLYKMAGGKFFYRLFRMFLLKVKYVSLPNLILDKPAIREFIMDQMRYDLVRIELQRLLYDDDCRDQMIKYYEELSDLLGETGAAGRAARTIYRLLRC
jgi:lipid-A-disaccharide synthase